MKTGLLLFIGSSHAATLDVLIFYENTVNEKRESFVIALRKIGDINLVKSFMF